MWKMWKRLKIIQELKLIYNLVGYTTYILNHLGHLWNIHLCQNNELHPLFRGFWLLSLNKFASFVVMIRERKLIYLHVISSQCWISFPIRLQNCEYKISKHNVRNNWTFYIYFFYQLVDPDLCFFDLRFVYRLWKKDQYANQLMFDDDWIQRMMQTTLRRCSTYILDQFSSYGDGGVALPAEGKQLVVQEKCWFRFYRPTLKRMKI